MMESIMKLSNLSAVKNMAIVFLHQEIKDTEFSPVFIMHPIFESAYMSAVVDGKPVIVNICEDEKGKSLVFSKYENRIKQETSIFGVYSIIRKSFRLTFLKYIWEYLSDEDKGELLKHAWISSENPNQDVNVSIPELIQMFSEVDHKNLMSSSEMEFLQSLPDEFTVYRGVAAGRNPNGLSWTPNRELAQWFAHRFDESHEKGYVQCGVAHKKDVLAYFNSRGEEEIVISKNKLENVKILKEN